MGSPKKDTLIPARLVFYKWYVDDTKIHGKEKIIDELSVIFYGRKKSTRERAAKTPKF